MTAELPRPYRVVSRRVDTAELGDVEPLQVKNGEKITLQARSTIVLQAAR